MTFHFKIVGDNLICDLCKTAIPIPKPLPEVDFYCPKCGIAYLSFLVEKRLKGEY